MTPEQLTKALVGYGRQSHAEREDSESLETQREKGEAWAVTHDTTLAGWHVDPNVSGSVPPLERPGFAAAVAQLEAAGGGVIVVSDLSRLSRGDVGATLMTLRELHDARGIDVASISPNIDPTDPTGRAIRTVILAFAELEREVTSEKIAAGKLAAARRGKCLTAPELGFDLSDDGYRVPNAEAELVREMFERVVRDGIPATLRWLRAGNGGVDSHGKPRQWTRTWLKRVLERKAYLGTAEWNGIVVEDAHPPLVDRDTWTLAQRELQGLEPFGREQSESYPLTNTAVCAVCGEGLRGTKSGGRMIEGTTKRSGRAYRGRCPHGVYVRADALEAGALGALVIEAEHRESDAEQHPEVSPYGRPAPDDAVEAAARALEAAKLERQADLENLALPADALATRVAAHDARIAQLEQAYSDALAAAQAAETWPTSTEIERAGVAGVPDALRRLYGPDSVITVRPGSTTSALDRIAFGPRPSEEDAS
jgi:DNA invertase Pin-like site-specific DNA recombinase